MSRDWRIYLGDIRMSVTVAEGLSRTPDERGACMARNDCGSPGIEDLDPASRP